jgi:hypothetical protein
MAFDRDTRPKAPVSETRPNASQAAANHVTAQ